MASIERSPRKCRDVYASETGEWAVLLGQFFSGDASMSCASLGTNFTNGRAIYEIDFEKTGSHALLSGTSTKGGETLTMEFRNVGGIVLGDYLDVFQVQDVIANLRMGAYDVLD